MRIPFLQWGQVFRFQPVSWMEEILPGLGVDVPFLMVLPVLGFGSEMPVEEEGSGFFEFGFGVAGSEEAVVADFDEASGEHME